MTELENDLNRIKQEKLNKIIPENIKKGVNVFGVVGTLEAGGGVDTSDATATANDIKTGTTAYTATGKAEGTLTFDKFTPDYTNCLNKASQIEGSVPLENPYFVKSLTNQDVKPDNYKSNIRTWVTSIPLLDTSKVTNMERMFNGCTNLTSIPLLDTSNVTDMGSMFFQCPNLITIPELNTLNVTDMSYMFNDCKSLTTIPKLNTSKVTNMGYMFCNCPNLTSVPLLNTSKVTNMDHMFPLTNLTEIPLLDTSKVTNMKYMFQSCSSLTTIPKLDTSSVTDMKYMFNQCPKLSDESLNNILQMCANAKAYGNQYHPKTLREISLDETQINKCKTLSNYQAFLDAGWTA